MAEPGLPENVQRFIAAHIHSIEHLEVLLLLLSAPEKPWTLNEVYRAILSNEHSVDQTLEWLASQGLIARAESSPVQYRFAPGPAENQALIKSLAELYKERRVRVVECIYRPPSSAVEEFARAFRIRKLP